MQELESVSKKLESTVEEFEEVAKESAGKKGIQHLTWTSPAVIGLLIASLGLIGNFVVASYNNRNTVKLGVLKLHSELILQAVNSHSLQESCQNLLFYINSGLLVDKDDKITQECTQPLQQTYIPATGAQTGGAPVAQEMAITVKKTDLGAKFQYAVAFTIPDVPNASFSLVKIYCTQLTGMNRTGSKSYPFLRGDWKPGDRVTFNVQVSKDLANSQNGWNLTFCTGSETVCYPSPNLLLFNS
jgi:hypothetical protein